MPGLLRRISFQIKRTAAVVWHRSGLWLLWKRVVLRNRAVVLTYHRVLSDGDAARSWSHPSIIVTRETFDQQMRLLRRWFRVLSLDEFVDRMKSGQPFESGSCLVTFDDGWKDTYEEAWPILRAHDIPAVVFLPVQYIGGSAMFWQEEIGASLYTIWERAQKDPAFAATARTELSALGLTEILGVGAARARELALDFVRRCKRDADDVERVRAALRPLTGGARPEVDGFMTWDQVREMSAGGIAFGAHGVTHRLLPTLTASDVLYEVAESKAQIAQQLGGAVASFSYPNGDWTPAVVDTVRDQGFTVAFSTEPGHIESPAANHLAIERINMHEAMTADSSMFLARILGAI